MATSQLEESDVPWTTAPEHARELLRELGVEKGTRMWNLSVEYARKHGLNGDISRQPKSVGAGSVYLCGLLCNKKTSQREMEDLTGVSPATLRESYLRIGTAEGYFDERPVPGDDGGGGE